MRVCLLEHATTPPGVLPYLERRLPSPFVPLEPQPWVIPADWGLDRTRQQHNAAQLLEALPEPREGEAVLAVVGLDLFLPVLTYVFGASVLGHRKSVLSCSRLRPASGEWTRMHRRVLVEALHELGHGLGLVHCPLASCAMHQSFHPEAVDLKEPDYCPSCRLALRGLSGEP